MGRLKIKGELKRQTLCITLPPKMVVEIQQIADERIISASALVEKCLKTPTTLDNLLNGIEVLSKSVV